MITSNIDVEDGLVNGAVGILEHVTLYENNLESPKIIWLNFNDKFVGNKARCSFVKYIAKNNLKKVLVPIMKVCLPVNINDKLGIQIKRNQFPLTAAEAMTIHKSQGQTYQEVCINTSTSKRVTIPMLYVALSRVTSLNGLFILKEFNPPKKINECLTNEISDLRKNRKVNLFFSNDFKGNELKVIYHNARSLKLHFKHVLSDQWYHQANILVFSETRVIGKNLNIPGYYIKYQVDAIDGKKGVIIFVKNNLL